MSIDWTELSYLFKGANILNWGYELLPLILSIVLALAIAKEKKDYGIAFIFCYVVMYVLGWAQEPWLLVVTCILAGVYSIVNK